MGVTDNAAARWRDVGSLQVMVAVALFCGALESRNRTDVTPLPVGRPDTVSRRGGDDLRSDVPLDALTLYGVVPPETTNVNVLPVQAVSV